MIEGNIPIENSPEKDQTYWASVRTLLADDDPRRKNSGVVELLFRMTPELLEENYELYEEGFDLTMQALALEDTERTTYYPVRICAVCTLVNVIDHIQENPKAEYMDIYTKAALATEEKAYDENEHSGVRFYAKAGVRKYLKGKRKNFFR